MKHVRLVAVLAAGFVVASCQTIVEDMPESSVAPSGVVPIVVVQLPYTQPTAAPSGGGGGGTGGLPPSQPTQAPTTPPGGGGGGGGGGQPGCSGWPNNCNPVASIHAHVYFLICGGAVVDAKYATEGPGDCDVRLDATPKDAQGKHTQAKGQPSWDISGSSWYVGNNPYTPTVRGGRGGFTATMTIDGVTSNVINYTFR